MSQLTHPADQPTLALNNGLKMPVIGLGTFKGRDSEGEDMVYNAIKIGYRHIDTAAIYGNETEVGVGIARAIADGLVERKDLFVVTKLWQNRHKDAEAAIKESLQKLGLAYVDLYLIHWPVAWDAKSEVDNTITLEEVWRKMESFVEQGLTRSIGVSNYNCQEIEDLVKYAKIQPVVNQVEIHPYFNNFKLQKVCNKHNIYLTAYSALMPPSDAYKYIPWVDMTIDPVVVKIAKKHNASPQQILIRWNIEVGNSVITKSTKEERLKANYSIISLKLDDDDMAELNSLTKPKRYRNPHNFKMPVEQWFFNDEVDVEHP